MVYTIVDVAPKQPYHVKLDRELIQALRAIKTREGIPESEQIRRGIRLWLQSKGVKVEADRQRASKARRRP